MHTTARQSHGDHESNADATLGRWADLLVALLEAGKSMEHTRLRRMAILEAMREEAIHVIPVRHT